MSEATIYLLKAIGDLLTIAILLNFFFRALKVDYYNPLVQGIIKVIDPPLSIFRTIIKPLYGIDFASLFSAVFTQAACFYLVALTGIITSDPITIVYWSFFSVILLSLRMIFWIMLLGIIISWVAPRSRHPAVALLVQVADPFFRPFRIFLPPMGGLDFSPILAFIFLNFLQILLRNFAVEAGLPVGLSMGF